MQRSLALLRDAGWTADVVERRVPGCFITKDLYGFIDILAMKIGQNGVLGVQTTSAVNLSARQKKILATTTAKPFLRCGNRIVLHGWAKRGPRGRAKHWNCTIREVVLREDPMYSENFIMEVTEEEK